MTGQLEVVTRPVPVHEDELFLDDRIFATHHRAAGSTFAIVVPPLFEEHARTRKVLVNIARVLAGAGIDALRFDYPGTGFSAGSTSELTLAAAEAALRAAIGFARARGASRIDLLGFRFGGYLAARCLREVPDARLVLWEPLLDLRAYFDELLRIETSSQLMTFGKVQHPREELVARLRAGRSVLLDGNRIAPELHRDLVSAPPIDLDVLPPTTTLLLWESKKLHEAARKAGVKTALLEDVRFSWRHIRTLEPRSATLFQLTLGAVRS